MVQHMKKTEAKKDRVKMLPPVRLTKQQREWLEKKSARTGHALSVIIRDLIQDQISKARK